MKLTVEEVKQVFLNVIEEKITFENAGNWASNMMNLDNTEELECEEKDLRKIFGGLAFLSGIDLMYTPGNYLHSMQNVETEYKDLFTNELSTSEIIEKVFVMDWDPLGLGNNLNASEKYQQYFGHVYNLLFWNKSKKEISDYLYKIQTEDMGRKGQRETTDKLAQLLLDLTHDYFH